LVVGRRPRDVPNGKGGVIRDPITGCVQAAKLAYDFDEHRNFLCARLYCERPCGKRSNSSGDLQERELATF
jgi:hypothetical protein